MKDKTLVRASVLASVAASVCCIVPVLFAGAGTTALAVSAGFAPLRPYLLVATGLLLAAGFYYAYRPARAACEPGTACARAGSQPGQRLAQTSVWLAAAFAVVLATFPYWSAGLIRATTPASAAPAAPGEPLQKVTLRVSGMSCEGCAANIEQSLGAQPGVRVARVSFAQQQAYVEYEPSRTSLPQLRQAIEKAGYKVEESRQ